MAVTTEEAVSTNISTGTHIAFNQFWKWLKEHPNCLLRAGTADAVLYDHENLHWYIYEDEDRNPVVQLIMGKTLLGEMILDVTNILYVQVSLERQEDDEPPAHLFEIMAGSAEESWPAFHFVLVHGMEGHGKHGLVAH